MMMAGRPVAAGVADSPLPNLKTGSTTRHVFTVPGVMKNNNLETEFICTSLESSATIRVGVEVFSAIGGSPLNNVNDGVGDGSMDIGPGATASIGTGNTPAIHEDVVITLGAGTVKNGSARILATSSRITCSAFVTDDLNDPPASMVDLKVIVKKKQKGE
jgi:hypothetical protein